MMKHTPYILSAILVTGLVVASVYAYSNKKKTEKNAPEVPENEKKET